MDRANKVAWGKEARLVYFVHNIDFAESSQALELDVPPARGTT